VPIITVVYLPVCMDVWKWHCLFSLMHAFVLLAFSILNNRKLLKQGGKQQ